ncbi:hypothetical protein [Micromonospora sp. SL4-19]|uniref:hypothetical protein n=1 Tax=Micromonospora sp. SL4-19 TaxID=3399129 RepID=UPI003A4D9C1C
MDTVPWYAAAWLVDGHDSQTLRELAGLSGRDPHAVRDLLPAALAEIGIALPTTDLAAAADAFRHLAELCLTGRAGERWVARMVRGDRHPGDYSNSVVDLPLGQLYGADVAGEGGWGQPSRNWPPPYARHTSNRFPSTASPDPRHPRRRAGHEALPMSEY